MPNQFYVPPPNINPLQSLMQGYKTVDDFRTQGQTRAARQAAQQALEGGGDTRGALARLIGAGDIQGAQALAQFGNQGFDQDYKTKMLGIYERNATRQETPAPLQILNAAGIDPRSEAGRNALFPKANAPLAPADKKAIMAAEDDIPRLDATIANIKRAKGLNPTVFSGPGASMRGSLGASLPDLMVPDFIADKKGSEATAEWDQLMGAEAIKNMSETLKGASTDFEMKKFISIAADTSKPPKVREAAMDRFLSLAEAEKSLRVRRTEELRGGSYFKPGGGQQGGGMTREQYNALPPGSPYTAPDGSQRIKR